MTTATTEKQGPIPASTPDVAMSDSAPDSVITGIPSEHSTENNEQEEKTQSKISKAVDSTKQKASELTKTIADSTKETYQNVTDASRERYDRVARSAKKKYETTVDTTRDTFRGNPLSFTLGAFAAGILVGLAIPQSRKERDALAKPGRKAREMGEAVTEKAQATANAAVSAAANAAQEELETTEK